MTSVTEIRKAIRELLADVPGTVQVLAGPSEYATGPGFDKLGFVVSIHVGPPSPKGEETLDELIAPSGVKATLEADDKLGGLVSDLTVTRSSGHRLFELPSAEQVLGAEWTVQILP